MVENGENLRILSERVERENEKIKMKMDYLKKDYSKFKQLDEKEFNELKKKTNILKNEVFSLREEVKNIRKNLAFEDNNKDGKENKFDVDKIENQAIINEISKIEKKLKEIEKEKPKLVTSLKNIEDKINEIKALETDRENQIKEKETIVDEKKMKKIQIMTQKEDYFRKKVLIYLFIYLLYLMF